MAHSNFTLKLGDRWDLELNDAGHIVEAHRAEAVAQNVANEGRCFTNDLYFDVDHGIPWFTAQLAKPVLASVTGSYLRDAAEAVDGVARVREVVVNAEAFDARVRDLTAEIQFDTTDGETVTLAL